MGFVVLYRKY